MGIDRSVGTIVWVRRRNGSWWPGRILGPEELSESHILSPRSGTPVKLLGREDASVDWYNLEKSKRVKAFRCGEFDDCIQRAESTQGIPIKKREKYARREDAILHALELEGEHLEKKRQKLGIGSNYMSYKTVNTSNKDLGISSPPENYLGNDNARDRCRFLNLKSQMVCKQPDSSIEEESNADILYVRKGKHAKPWEDDSSEAIPRMRGLQDLGLAIAPSKRYPSASISFGSSAEPVPLPVDNRIYALSNVANNTSSIKNPLSVKRKISQGGLAEESVVKRRDRRRPLVQVLQSSAKLPVSVPIQYDGNEMPITMQAKKEQMSPSHFGMDTSLIHRGSLTEEYTSSGLIEAQESSSSEGDYLDPDIQEDEALLSDPTSSGRYICYGDSVYQVPIAGGNLDNEETPEESELSSYVSQHHPVEQIAGISSDMGGSRWQLKGKRNIRNLMKRPMEIIDGKDSIIIHDKCNGDMHESVHEGKGNTLKTARKNGQRSLVQQDLHYRSKELTCTYDESILIENDFGHTQNLGSGNRKYPSMLKASSRCSGRSNSNTISSDEGSPIISPSVWESDLLSHATLKGYWQGSAACFDPVYVGNFGDRMESVLVDVDLKVQASYQGKRVPLVSLMSRLNGKAIVGHPVQIETLEDDSSYALLCRGDFCEDLPGIDGNSPLPPVWRTARRTTMHRVPRPPSSALEGEEGSTFQDSDLERKFPFNKPYAGNGQNKLKTMKGTFAHIHRPLLQKKFPKKLPKKKVSLSSQKTRTLSSIAIEQKPSRRSRDSKLADENVELYGLIKPEGTKPVVACVPVKLAFSRIREAIGRPPSTPANHGVLIASFEERKPL